MLLRLFIHASINLSLLSLLLLAHPSRSSLLELLILLCVKCLPLAVQARSHLPQDLLQCALVQHELHLPNFTPPPYICCCGAAFRLKSFSFSTLSAN